MAIICLEPRHWISFRVWIERVDDRRSSQIQSGKLDFILSSLIICHGNACKHCLGLNAQQLCFFLNFTWKISKVWQVLKLFKVWTLNSLGLNFMSRSPLKFLQKHRKFYSTDIIRLKTIFFHHGEKFSLKTAVSLQLEVPRLFLFESLNFNHP